MNLTTIKQLLDSLEALKDVKAGRPVRQEYVKTLEGIVVAALIEQGTDHEVLGDNIVIRYGKDKFVTNQKFMLTKYHVTESIVDESPDEIKDEATNTDPPVHDIPDMAEKTAQDTNSEERESLKREKEQFEREKERILLEQQERERQLREQQKKLQQEHEEQMREKERLEQAERERLERERQTEAEQKALIAEAEQKAHLEAIKKEREKLEAQAKAERERLEAAQKEKEAEEQAAHLPEAAPITKIEEEGQKEEVPPVQKKLVSPSLAGVIAKAKQQEEEKKATSVKPVNESVSNIPLTRACFSKTAVVPPEAEKDDVLVIYTAPLSEASDSEMLVAWGMGSYTNIKVFPSLKAELIDTPVGDVGITGFWEEGQYRNTVQCSNRRAEVDTRNRVGKNSHIVLVDEDTAVHIFPDKIKPDMDGQVSFFYLVTFANDEPEFGYSKLERPIFSLNGTRYEILARVSAGTLYGSVKQAN